MVRFGGDMTALVIARAPRGGISDQTAVFYSIIMMTF